MNLNKLNIRSIGGIYLILLFLLSYVIIGIKLYNNPKSITSKVKQSITYDEAKQLLVDVNPNNDYYYKMTLIKRYYISKLIIKRKVDTFNLTYYHHPSD